MESSPEIDELADTVTLTTTGNADTEKVDITVSSELMKNHAHASPIDPSKNVEVVQDADGHPMVFSLGSDDGFHLITHDTSASSGFSAVDLGTEFSKYAGTTAFDVSQDLDGHITVAVAFEKSKGKGTDVFVASMLSNDYDTVDWSDFSSLAKKVKGIKKKFVAENIRMGTSDDGGPSLLLVEGQLGDQKYYYQVQGKKPKAKRFEFPENVEDSDEVQDISLGYAFGQRGKYFLYEQGDSQTLECTTLPTEDEGSETYDYSPGNKKLPKKYRHLEYNCIATPTGSETDPFFISSDIYVGAKSGVYLFKDAKASDMKKITSDISDVHDIVVEEDDESISLWVMCSPNKLYYIYGKKGSTYDWNDPILFDESTLHIAPIRNRKKNANDVFVVTQDRTVKHHWQDPETTLWSEREINVKDEAYLHDNTSYTTQLSLTDADGNPLANKEVQITCSEWVYAEANGSVYSFDQDNPATVRTDPRGTITIVRGTDDISSPIFYVDADFLKKTLNVYPSGKIERGLQKIKSGKDLKHAKTQNGESVVEESFDDSTFDGIASNVQKLTKSGGKYMDETRADGHDLVAVTEKGEKHTGQLKAAHVPDDFTMGMKLEEDGWSPVEDSTEVVTGGASKFFASVGDAFRHIGNAFKKGIEKIEDGITYLKDGVSFVIHKAKEGLNFVLNIGKKVLNIALEGLSAVLKALNWVFKMIGVGLKKFLEWLGHLFGWDDIWKTHKVIASMMTSGVDYVIDEVENEIETWRSELKKTFDTVDTKIDDLKLSKEVKKMKPHSKQSEAKKELPGMNFNSPAMNRPFYQIQHGGMLSGSTSVSHGSDPFTAFLEDIVIPTGTDLANDLQTDAEDIADLFGDSGMTVENVLDLCADLTHTVVDPAEDIIDGSLKFLEDLLGSIKKALTDTFHVPFLSSFYEWLTGLLGEKEKFTLVNALSLVVAIPFTIFFKIVVGRAPFENGAMGLDDPDLFETLMGGSLFGGATALEATDEADLADGMTALAAAEDDDELLTGDSKSIVKTFTVYAGLIGAFTTIVQCVCSVLASAADEVSTSFQIFNTTLGFMSYLLFTPVPKTFDKKSAYRTRLAGWLIGVIWTIVLTIFQFNPRLKKFTEGKRQMVIDGISAAIRVVRLILYLVADGLSGADGWGWSADILMMGGLLTTEVGSLIPRKDIKKLVQVLGAGATFFGSLLVLPPLVLEVS